MLGKNLPRRNAKRKHKIALIVVLVILIAAAVALMLKWQTVRYIFFPEEITMRTAEDTRSRIESGNYTIIEEWDTGYAYTALAETVTVRVTTDDQEITAMEAEMNVYDLQKDGMAEAMNYVNELLLPYYTEAQIEAMVAVVTPEALSAVKGNEIDYQRIIGGYSLTAEGSISTGDMIIKAVRE